MPLFGLRRTDYFNDAVKYGRKIREKTLREVSEATGISAGRISACERGLVTITPDEFVRIWKYLSSDEARPAPASPAGGSTLHATGLVSATKSEVP